MTEGSREALALLISRGLATVDSLPNDTITLRAAIKAMEDFRVSRTAPDGGRAMALEEAAQAVRAIKRPSVDFYGAVARHLDLAEETIRALADGEKSATLIRYTEDGEEDCG